MINFKEIYEGWRNAIIPPKKLKDVINEVASSRLLICRQCEYNSDVKGHRGIRQDEHCLKCGCPLFAKTRSLASKCPIDKWKAVATDEEEHKINTLLDADSKDD